MRAVVVIPEIGRFEPLTEDEALLVERDWQAAVEELLCITCETNPRTGHSTLCHDCHKERVAKAVKTKRRLGIKSGWQRLRTNVRASSRVGCPWCDAVVDSFRASWHAWDQHRRAVPAEDVPNVFRVVEERAA